jgi:hypothetical protein
VNLSLQALAPRVGEQLLRTAQLRVWLLVLA